MTGSLSFVSAPRSVSPPRAVAARCVRPTGRGAERVAGPGIVFWRRA